jgi:hypothetical protein
MFPKTGKFFPDGDGGGRGEVHYAQAIAAALVRDLGTTHQAAKTAMRWTGAHERTVKNWLAARYGPSGRHLIDLMRHSDAVLGTALQLAGRTEAITATGLIALRHRLAETVMQIDELTSGGGTDGDENPQPPEPD